MFETNTASSSKTPLKSILVQKPTKTYQTPTKWSNKNNKQEDKVHRTLPTKLHNLRKPGTSKPKIDL